MADTSERDLNPTVEDYDSDQSEPVVESFRRSPAANVAAKRSHDLSNEKQNAEKEKVLNVDLQSDSGYSTNTAGTMSSTNSVPSAKVSQTASSTTTAPSSVPSERRPTLVSEDRKRSSQSPRKTLQRNNSVSTSKRPPTSRRQTVSTDECTDPNCTECGPSVPAPSRPRRPTTTAPNLLTRDNSFPPSDTRSQRSDPATTYTSQPSPAFNRQPGQYTQGAAVVQPAQTRPRGMSHSRGRPMSYHGGDPGASYWPQPTGMPAPYPSPPQDYGQPQPMSAPYNMPPPHQSAHQMQPFPMMGATPPQYFQGGHLMAQHMLHGTPPYEHQRPQLSTRNSSSYNARFGPPLVTQDNKEPQMPSARFGAAPPQSANRERFALTNAPHVDPEDSDPEYYSGEELPRAPKLKQIMAPPPQPKLQRSKSKARREEKPTSRRSKAPKVTQEPSRRERRESMSYSATLPERPKERDSRAARVSTVPPSRSVSVKRPAPPKRLTQSAYDTPRHTTFVENSVSRRRQSYQAPVYAQSFEDEYDDEYDSEEEEELQAQEERRMQDERRRKQDQLRAIAEAQALEKRRLLEERQALEEQRRRRRNSRVYRDDNDENFVVSDRPPRRRDSARYDSYTENRNVMNDAEAYQQRTRGAQEPLSEQIHKVAKQRASRTPSDADRKTRISQSARTNVTNGNGEIRFRVDASAPLSFTLKGDVEGRTVRIDPAEDGMADIVIIQQGEDEEDDEDEDYDDDEILPSERSSNTGNRRSTFSARAEERSNRSGRSNQPQRTERIVESRRDRLREQEMGGRSLRHPAQRYL